MTNVEIIFSALKMLKLSNNAVIYVIIKVTMLKRFLLDMFTSARLSNYLVTVYMCVCTCARMTLGVYVCLLLCVCVCYCISYPNNPITRHFIL